MAKSKKLTQKDIATLLRVRELLDKIADEKGEIPLPNDNKSVGTQLSCASAAIETILQYFL